MWITGFRIWLGCLRRRRRYAYVLSAVGVFFRRVRHKGLVRDLARETPSVEYGFHE